MNEIITVDWDLLDNISYRTKLGKSLKNTLRKFDKSELFSEINDAISFFTENESLIKDEHRIKSLQSCSLKYERYFPSKEAEKVFNDVLGIRIVVSDYSVLDNVLLPEHIQVVDMRLGKAKDDGYRGIHIYYQKDHEHYPIEVQFMTPRDRQFNEWLHVYVYKYVDDTNMGRTLREMYDCGKIKSEDDFRKEMKKYVLSYS